MSDKRSVWVVLTVIVVTATLVQLSTDIYTPSLPAIAEDLSASLGQVQWTMAAFVLGVAMTNLVYGPVSEGVGRRYTLLGGLTVSVVGLLICVSSHSIEQLQWGRFVQGCGLGACNALWRSIFRDHYSGEALARMSSYLLNFVILAAVIAPFVGGYIQQYLGWHAVFIVLLVWVVLVMALIAFGFRESNSHRGKHRLNGRFILAAYKEILTNRVFLSFAAVNFFAYGGLFAWLTSGSVILIRGVGITPVEFGYLMIACGCATAAGGFINARLLKRIGLQRMLILGFGCMGVAGVVLLVLVVVWGAAVLTVLLPVLLFIMGSTLVFMNAFALAFEPVGHIAGYAGAIYASIQLLGATLFASVLSHLSSRSPMPLALAFIVSGLLAGAAYGVGCRYKKTVR